MSVGALFTAGVSYLAVYERRVRPFVLLSVSLGVSTTTARADDGSDARLTAGDFRAGVAVGKTFFDQLSIYALARGFAGPVFWRLGGEDVQGGDAHHYAFGGGAVWHRGRVELFAEGAALGERSFTAGTSFSF